MMISIFRLVVVCIFAELLGIGHAFREASTEGACTDDERLDNFATMAWKFSVEPQTLKGTQCIHCESSNALDEGDRLVFENRRLVLYIKGNTPERQQFARYFRPGSALNVDVVYSKEDKRVVLFTDGNTEETKQYTVANDVNWQTGFKGCWKSQKTKDSQYALDGDISSFSLENSLPEIYHKDFEQKLALAQQAGTNFASQVQGLNTDCQGLQSCVQEYEGLLAKIWKCRESDVKTPSLLQAFECNSLDPEVACDLQLVNFQELGAKKLKELNDEFGNCDLTEVKTKATSCYDFGGECQKAQCGVGDALQLASLSGNYLGWFYDVKAAFEEDSGVTFNGNKVTLNTPPRTHNPIADDDWVKTVEKTVSSLINLHGHENPLVDLAWCSEL